MWYQCISSNCGLVTCYSTISVLLLGLKLNYSTTGLTHKTGDDYPSGAIDLTPVW